MLVSVTRLNISNTGYKNSTRLETIFINTEKIVSIVNYEEIKSFLIREGSDLSDRQFSLLKISSNTEKEQDLIVLGSPQDIVASFNTTESSNRGILLD